MDNLIQYESKDWIKHFKYIKGHYYSYVRLKDGSKYLFDFDIPDKKKCIKAVYKYLNVKNKKEYALIDERNCIEPLFYKHTGDMSLICINSFVNEARNDSAEYIAYPFDYGDCEYIND